ncbi:MAG: hypothetical protein WCA46_21825, partial [Actinocatenispora sp.]
MRSTPDQHPTADRSLRSAGFLRTLLYGGVSVVAVGTPLLPEQAADPVHQPPWRRVPLLAGLVTVGGGQTVGVLKFDALMRRAARYLLLAPIAYRLLALLGPVLAMTAMYGPARLTPILSVAVVLTALNVVVVGAVVSRPRLTDGQLRALLAGDLLLAIAANVLAGATVPGPLDTAHHDVFWGYLVGTVVLWAGAWGLAASLLPIALSVPIQAAMILLNPGGVGPHPLAGALGRFLWLLLAVAVSALVLALIGLGMRLAILVGFRSGRQAERARLMRGMHDTVLQTLEAMALSSGLDHAEPATALAELRGMARSQATLLRRSLGELSEGRKRELSDDLAEVVAEAVGEGLPVELVIANIDDRRLSADRRHAVRDAVREALRNTRKHAGRCDAVVRVDEADGGIRVVVRDHGKGFAADGQYGFGLTESVQARLREVGGRATVESWP